MTTRFSPWTAILTLSLVLACKADDPITTDSADDSTGQSPTTSDNPTGETGASDETSDTPPVMDCSGLVIAATLTRDPPGDALVLRPGLSFEDFRRMRGKGFKIGTNAVRRAAYARRLFPDAEIIHYRGAADTRVRKLDGSELQRLPGGGALCARSCRSAHRTTPPSGAAAAAPPRAGRLPWSSPSPPTALTRSPWSSA